MRKKKKKLNEIENTNRKEKLPKDKFWFLENCNKNDFRKLIPAPPKEKRSINKHYQE